MKEKEFFNWLVKAGVQDNSARSIVSRVRRIEEAYPDLDSRFEDNSIETLLNIFVYTKNDEAKKREPLHKIEIDGNRYTGTQSLRNALVQYIEFRGNEKKTIAKSSDANITSEDTQGHSTKIYEIYKIDEFCEWMYWLGGLTKESAKSYVSNLKALRLNVKRKNDEVLLIDLVSNLLRQGKVAIALQLLEKIDEAVSRQMLSRKLDSREKKSLNDWRSALRKYVLFLQENIEDVPDEEELGNIDTAVPVLTTQIEDEYESKADDRLIIPISDLKHNFAFRLKTQNRMSNNKDTFYPIGMICKLFNYSQRKAKGNGIDNDDSDWLKNWIEDYVNTILVITTDGEYPLSQVKEIIIYPETGKVSLHNMRNLKESEVLTETPQHKSIPMQAQCLRDIHIDHTPLMNDVLTANMDALPALTAMSKIIKEVANKKKIDIQTLNFGKISKALFENAEIIDERLLPLIPEIKKELNFLRKEGELKLMQGSHNLRKK